MKRASAHERAPFGFSGLKRHYDFERLGPLRLRVCGVDLREWKMVRHQIFRAHHPFAHQFHRLTRIVGTARITWYQAGLIKIEIVRPNEHFVFGRGRGELHDGGALARSSNSAGDGLARAWADDHDVGHRTLGDFTYLFGEVVAGDEQTEVGAEFPRTLGAVLEQIGADNRARTHMARDPDVHHPHDPETDHENRLARPERRAAQ